MRPEPLMRRIHRLVFVSACVAMALLLVRCSAPATPQAEGGAGASGGAVSRGAVKVRGVSLNDPVRPAADDHPITFGAARNEWASFAVQVSGLPKPSRKTAHVLRVQAPQLEGQNASIGVDRLSAAQILPMPVDVNRAGFVRHTGLSAGSRQLPRALLPVAMDNGVVNLAAARDPRNPTDPRSRAEGSAEPLLFWIDLHVPPETDPGEYVTTVDVLQTGSPAPLASVPVKITVYDFVLRDERDLIMTSRITWEDLKRLYPERFETVTPRLINRDDPRYAGTVKVLDSLVKLAQQHRVEVTIPRLQPTVKWPAGRPPQVDWSDLDTVLAPWLSGEAFADKIPLGHWPLPAVDQLDRFDRKSQLEYWKDAATHFEQKEWLARAPLTLELPVPGRASGPQAIQMSVDAAEILGSHPNVRVSVPLEEDQIHLADGNNANFIDPQSTSRVLAAGPGIVFNTLIQKWPQQKAVPPKKWLRTDVPGLVPYVGAGGDERDVRVWAWLAFLRQAELIQWGSPLPRTQDPREPADPNDLVWFYPGSWFGIDEPVPTIQLKWLRRAQQDFEYLWLARQRGEVINASLMARLMAKPVEIQPGQQPDPTYALMTGTADPDAWTEGQKLLARTILLREAGERRPDADRANELNLQLLRWMAPQDQALLMGRTTLWGFAPEKNNWINLNLGIDIYNASDTRPDQNRLLWTSVPKGWEVRPQPLTVPALATYHVDRFLTEARFDLNAIDADDRRPVELTFVNGFSNAESKLRFVLPVAASDRLGPGLNVNDAKLDDWEPSDQIQNGPMVRMFNRPALQRQEIQFAQQPAEVYTGWADENFYVAFKLKGIGTSASGSRNTVDYQFRRAWGEDLCELLVQPVFEDNSLGPVLHVVCKPAGHWVERKQNPRLHANPWQPFVGAAIRYTAGTSTPGAWTGELAIPWKAITDRDNAVPKLLRFNFVQHVHATGESASWAGPIDFGRDDSFMGLLYVRDASNPGLAEFGR